jgi:glutamate racemase
MQSKLNTQPDAPLPWKRHRDNEFGSVDLNGDGDYAGEAYSQRDADYIVLACNSYPQLVEALRDTLDVLDSMASAHHTTRTDRQAMNAARSILRKLGEIT